MVQSSDFNSQVFNVEPTRIIDNLSDIEVYIGTSSGLRIESEAIWRIKRYVNINGIRKFAYPNGKQDFNYVWKDRFTYNYQ